MVNIIYTQNLLLFNSDIFYIAETPGHHTYCTPHAKCGLGGGDCDKDDDCLPGLVCGTDNCKKSDQGENYHWQNDCCVRKGKRLSIFLIVMDNK